eukprot:gene2701-12561_t
MADLLNDPSWLMLKECFPELAADRSEVDILSSSAQRAASYTQIRGCFFLWLFEILILALSEFVALDFPSVLRRAFCAYVKESRVHRFDTASVEAEEGLEFECSFEGAPASNTSQATDAEQEMTRQPSDPLDDYCDELQNTCGSLRELEERYQLVGVWGQRTTSAMQMLDCIQSVKDKMIDQNDEDDGDIMSSSLFNWLFTASFLMVATGAA